MPARPRTPPLASAIRNNAELVALLEAEAIRRGERGIDWAEYFRNAGL